MLYFHRPVVLLKECWLSDIFCSVSHSTEERSPDTLKCSHVAGEDWVANQLVCGGTWSERVKLTAVLLLRGGGQGRQLASLLTSS